MIADIEELEEMDASEIHAKRLDAKDVSTPMKGELIIFPIADGTIKLSGGGQVLRTSTLIGDSPDRGEERGNLLGESDGSAPPLQDSSPDDGEARNDFWSISETTFIVVTLNPESNCTWREKHHSQFHWNIFLT